MIDAARLPARAAGHPEVGWLSTDVCMAVGGLLVYATAGLAAGHCAASDGGFAAWVAVLSVAGAGGVLLVATAQVLLASSTATLRTRRLRAIGIGLLWGCLWYALRSEQPAQPGFPWESVATLSGRMVADSRVVAAGSTEYYVQLNSATAPTLGQGPAGGRLRLYVPDGPPVEWGGDVRFGGTFRDGVWRARTVEVVPDGDDLWAWRSRLRGWLQAQFAVFQPSIAGLYNALVLGSADRLHPETRVVFRRAGASHVLALSGMHLAVLSGGVFLAAVPILGRRRAMVGVTIIVWLFVFLVGAKASLVRAAVMVTLAAWYRLTGRRVHPVRVLCRAFVVLVCVEPTIAGDLGFQLSFAALAGILVLSAPLAFALRRLLPAPVAVPLAASAAAFVFGLPLVAPVFGAVVPVSLVSGLVLGPAALVVVGVGLLWPVVGWLPPAVGQVLRPPVEAVATLFVAVAQRFAPVPPVPVSEATGVALQVAAVVALAAFLVAAAAERSGPGRYAGA